jgi:hypothetical protein
MKKLFTMLAVLLALVLACTGLAMAEDVAEEGDGVDHVHVHDWTIAPIEANVIRWPSASNATGLIRFICNNAGEYQTAEETAQDFIEYVIYPTDHVFPKDYEEALTLKDTDRMVSYTAPTCTATGSITIKCGHEHSLDMDGAKKIHRLGREMLRNQDLHHSCARTFMGFQADSCAVSEY